MTRTRTTIAALALLGALLGGCSATGDETVFAPATTNAPPPTTEAPPPPPTTDCNNDGTDKLKSYQPDRALPSPGAMPADSYMKQIQDRGRLIAGVSADTLLFGARNPIEGDLEGFDIDVVKQVALAIFGGPVEEIDQYIDYRVITYADRLPRLEDGSVDIVAHTMTINCTRWQRIAFSTEYFSAGQKVLVRKDNLATDVEQLAGAKICAADGSTNIEYIRTIETEPAIEVVGVADLTDCLVLFQQGDVDAVTGDDTVMAGFARQDPYAKVIGEKVTEEPYGLGINKDHVDFVKFVNSVLEQTRSNGQWQITYQTWLGGIAGFDAEVAPPTALYGRPEP